MPTKMATRSRPPAARGLRMAGLRARAGQDDPAERTAFPDPKTQWLEVRHSAYRCGGSTGIAKKRHRFPVSLWHSCTVIEHRSEGAFSFGKARADSITHAVKFS